MADKEKSKQNILQTSISGFNGNSTPPARLELAEETYKTIFDNSAVAITVSDKDERIVSWNKFAADLLGMTFT